MKTLFFLLGTCTSLYSSVIYNNNQYTSTYNTIDNFGYFSFSLVPSSVMDSPQFRFNFQSNSLTIEMEYSEENNYNKYSRIMGYIPSGQLTPIAALLLEGNEILTEGKWPSFGKFNLWWKPNTTGYLGLMVDPYNNGENFYYGWAKVTWNADTTITIHDSAYESTLNKSITVGSIPESNLSLLTMITIAVSLLERKRYGNERTTKK